MLTHMMLGAKDPKASADFFDAVLGALGHKRMFTMNDRYGWSAGEGTPPLIVGPPGDGADACHGNGTMLGFRAATRDQVHAAHEAGLKAGGKDEGAPGPRPAGPPNTYAAYLRDPTGNKIAVICNAPE